jgi:septal ring factor EnvC (AmiA/AmiB activator)
MGQGQRLCLMIGAAGGYAAMRFIQPDSGAATEGANSEVATLNEALVKAQQDASEARAKQAESSTQVEDLQAQLSRQAADLDAMVEKLAASSSEARISEAGSAALETLSRERDALHEENQSLKADLAAFEAERETDKQTASATEERMAAELARLQNEVLPELTAERDQLKRKTLMMLADQGALKARAKVAADRRAYDETRIAELQARLADAEQELAASQEVLDALKLEKRADKAPETSAGGVEVDAAKQPNTPENSTFVARKPDAVAQALRSAPGLETLSAADRQGLTEKLVAGECVTTALKSVFERVPILTLRNLIRDLNSDC